MQEVSRYFQYLLIILLKKSLGQHLIAPNILSHVLILFHWSNPTEAEYCLHLNLVTNSVKLPNLLLVRIRYMNWRLSTGHFDCDVQCWCSILVHSPYNKWKYDRTRCTSHKIIITTYLSIPCLIDAIHRFISHLPLLAYKLYLLCSIAVNSYTVKQSTVDVCFDLDITSSHGALSSTQVSSSDSPSFIFLNFLPYIGFVRMSAIISWVAIHLNSTSLLFIHSFTKKYLIAMCLVASKSACPFLA